MKVTFYIILSLFAVSGISCGAVIIQQLDTTGGAYHFSAQGYGQSFTPESDIVVSAIELSTKASIFGSYTSNITIVAYDRINRTLGSTALASGTLLELNVPASQAWATIEFAKPAKLLANTTYAFVVADGMSSSNQFYFSSNNSYAKGDWLNIGSGSDVTEMGIDSAFKLIGVPETSVFSLFSLALTFLLLERRRTHITQAEQETAGRPAKASQIQPQSLCLDSAARI